MELKVNKSEKVLFEKVQDRCDSMMVMMNYKQKSMPSAIFREIIKRLHAIGILHLQVDNQKITENIHLQLFVFYDEIKSAFQEH